MYAFIVSALYNTSGLDYAQFLYTVGTPSLIEEQAVAATVYHVNGVAGFYVPLPAGSCVKFDAGLAGFYVPLPAGSCVKFDAGLATATTATTAAAVDDLGIKISEMSV
jgi:hypothetical protein